MRQAFLYSSVLLLICCADEGPGVYGGALPLRELNPEPGCFENALPNEDETELEKQISSASRQMIEYQLDYAFAAAALLLEPVIADPNAVEWQTDIDNGHAEGLIMARGEDWAVIRMVVIGELNGVKRSVDGEINLLPDRVIIDFGDRELELTETFVRYGDIVRGCDPTTGISFEKTAVLFTDGTVHDATRCWPESLPTTACSGTDLEQCEAEFKAAWGLQCLQVIQRVLL